jgi:[acyl-carrier-protein] S-malonyltransferase
MKKAYIFPGQGSQFPGMAQELYNSCESAKAMFERANEILGFRITDIMFSGTAEELKQTKVTQPAIFLHSVILAKHLPDFCPGMVAGHSLGEFSALAAAGALDFEDALRLVAIRAQAMQKACESTPGAMAAVLMLADEKLEEACAAASEETGETVVAANYNCDGQVVISGSVNAVNAACVRCKEVGARRALPLPVGGAFHSPLMAPAREELAQAIEATVFHTPVCPIYQNVTALATCNPDEIKTNLLAQLTAPVRWTQSVRNMLEDGATEFIEIGPGKVLQGLTSKIAGADIAVSGKD